MKDFSASNVWIILISLFIIFASLFIADLLKKKIPFIGKTLLPTSVIGGTLLLILKSVWPWFNTLIDTNFMSVITYHMLALGFISTTLKGNPKKKNTEPKTVLNTGLVTVNSYVIQGIVGLAVSIPLSLVIKDLIPAAGLILPMGFGQGTGQALNWGIIYESNYGFNGGSSFGLSIAALGFVVACLVGVVYLNILKKKGLVKQSNQQNSGEEIVSTNGEEPASESIDKLTVQVVLVSFVYFITYLVMFGLNKLCYINGDNTFGTNTIAPLIWGFNFLFGTIFAVLFKNILGKLTDKKFLKYKVTNDYLLKRLTGFFFDIMIVAGVAAIDIDDLKVLWLPLLIMGVVGTIVTFIYLKIVSKHVWKGYEYQGMMSMFGMLTGTASTGMILLREIDGNFDTPASDNLVYQQVPAIAFGLPVLLLMSFAPKSSTNLYISLGILIVLFVVYNLILYRDKIFKKKSAS